MKKNKRDLFCFFSGYAHQDTFVIELHRDQMSGQTLLYCQTQNKHKLSIGHYIQLDGVLFEVIDINDAYFKVCSTAELIEGTSIEHIKVGDKLSLGILAEHDKSHEQLWMLQPSARGQVTYKTYSIAEGHQYTLKLDFEALVDFVPLIREAHHLGLAGSSLTARNVSLTDNLIKFSIYCGRETRENSQFNEYLKADTQINITEPADVLSP